MQEIKLANADGNNYSVKSLNFAVGTLRNLSYDNDSMKIQLVQSGLGESLMALCWLCDGDTREKAFGTLCNITSSAVASKLLVKRGLSQISYCF